MADIGVIINRLAPLIEKKVRKEYKLWINSKTEARKLYFNLKEIQKVLEEAERRRLADPRVKAWLENLQDVTYEIDDVLDEWETLDLQLQIEGSDDDDDDDVSHTWLKKVSIFIECLCSRSKHVFRRRDIALKIKVLNEKVDSLGKETAKYTLLPVISDSQDVKCEITTSFTDLVKIQGQQSYKQRLVDALHTSEREDPGGIKVISLVGMVGVGKTTVAQLAFNDPTVQSRFELKLWICVSHINSDLIRLTKAILQSLRVSYPEDAELQTLLELVSGSVSQRKFLLVLDHVRLEDNSIWNQLKASLRDGSRGSRIVVTSSNESVTNFTGSTEMIQVEPLDEEDCWLLFSEIALRRRSKTDREKLGGIGQSIAKKSKGLPLAAKTLGHYLQSRVSEELWEDVLEKEVWQLDEVAKALFAPLAFSYNELPLALKHCFSYCASLMEDVENLEIPVNELTKLWMVQGYTETELKGRDYFEKLARSSFFQDITMDYLGENVESCKMHCILHDFARYLTKTGSKVEDLRSFFADDQPPPSELGSLKYVRVLRLACCDMQELSSDIGNLIHLRYLELGGNPIRQLPVTICNLYNLQSLSLRYCTELSVFPKKIHRLRNLRHLLIDGSDISRLPQGLEKLTNLQTLDKFVVGREASKFGYLANLNQLRGFMHISIGNLIEKEDVEDAEKADLRSKIHIGDLFLFFKEEVSMDVMESLQAPPNLRCLRIRAYNGTQFPSWISTSLNMLRELQFRDCDGCLDLPPLGKLPFLERFRILGMESLKRVGRQFIEPSGDGVIFPKLRGLEFVNCDSWEEWEDITPYEASTLSIMPCLQELYLSSCNKLNALPNLLLHGATSLEKLTIFECSPLLSERYQPGSPDWEFIFQNRQS